MWTQNSNSLLHGLSGPIWSTASKRIFKPTLTKKSPVGKYFIYKQKYLLYTSRLSHKRSLNGITAASDVSKISNNNEDVHKDAPIIKMEVSPFKNTPILSLYANNVSTDITASSIHTKSFYESTAF